MENSNNTSRKIDAILDGETVLYRVRKVHKVAEDPASGFKPSIELVEYVDNPFKPVSAVAELNDDDDRFIQRKPQHAFQPVSLEKAIEGKWITQEQFDKLLPAKGVNIDDQKDGVHFIEKNILNPSYKGKRLRVQIIETTVTNRKGIQVKLNPRTNQPILYKGQPVYRIVQMAYEGNHESIFIESDRTTALLANLDLKDLLDEKGSVVKKSDNLNG